MPRADPNARKGYPQLGEGLTDIVNHSHSDDLGGLEALERGGAVMRKV